MERKIYVWTVLVLSVPKANIYILIAILAPSNTSNLLSPCTQNSRWDWWTEGVRPTSAPTVNGQGAAGANLCVSSPLVWHQKHGIILAETLPALQQDPGILLESKESSRKSAKFNSQTGQVDFLIRSLFLCYIYIAKCSKQVKIPHRLFIKHFSYL